MTPTLLLLREVHYGQGVYTFKGSTLRKGGYTLKGWYITHAMAFLDVSILSQKTKGLAHVELCVHVQLWSKASIFLKDFDLTVQVQSGSKASIFLKDFDLAMQV